MTSRWPDYGEWMLQNDLNQPMKSTKYLQIMVHRVPEKKLILKCPVVCGIWMLYLIFFRIRVSFGRIEMEKAFDYCNLASLNWRLIYGEFNLRNLVLISKHA